MHPALDAGVHPRVPASRSGIRSGTLAAMTRQIAVRLPDELVEFLDSVVSTGQAPSRAAVVSSAVEREMRRLLAENDARILAEVGPADDLDSVVDWSTTTFPVED